jgi:hypothetical protein
MKTMQGGISDFDRKYSIQREVSTLFFTSIAKACIPISPDRRIFAILRGRTLKKISMPRDDPIFEALQGGQKPIFDEKEVKARRARTHQQSQNGWRLLDRGAKRMLR